MLLQLLTAMNTFLNLYVSIINTFTYPDLQKWHIQMHNYTPAYPVKWLRIGTYCAKYSSVFAAKITQIRSLSGTLHLVQFVKLQINSQPPFRNIWKSDTEKLDHLTLTQPPPPSHRHSDVSWVHVYVGGWAPNMPNCPHTWYITTCKLIIIWSQLRLATFIIMIIQTTLTMLTATCSTFLTGPHRFRE